MQRLIWSRIYRIVGEVEMRKLCNLHNDWLLPCGFQMAVLVLRACQSCEILCNPMDCSLPSSVHGISQARILEWVAISSYRWSSWPRGWTRVSHQQAILYCWATWAAKWQGTGHKWPSQVSEQDTVGCFWNSPSPRPSALAPFWST